MLSCIFCLAGMACSFRGSMNPYRGPLIKLLPQKVGNFQRTTEPRDIDRSGLKPEMATGLWYAAAVRYLRVGGPPLRNIGTSAFAFDSASRAKEMLQKIRDGYLKQGYKISSEGSRKRNFFTLGEEVLLTHEPGKERFPNGQTLAFWRDGSVIFYAESYSENQREDVVEFKKNFP